MAQGDHSTLLRTWSKHFARAGLNWAIRCSYHSEHSANRLTASWQNVSHVSLRERERVCERERHRDRKGGIVVVAVMLSETLPQCCVLLLCISHCWRPSLSGQSSVSPETSASLLECPRGNSTPRQGAMDGRTPSTSTLIPSPGLRVRTVQSDLTNNLSCIVAKVQIKVHDTDINAWLHCIITAFNKIFKTHFAFPHFIDTVQWIFCQEIADEYWLIIVIVSWQKC